MSGSLSAHEQRVIEYYNRATNEFYIQRWNEEHIHFGLFEPGESVGVEQPIKSAVPVAFAEVMELGGLKGRSREEGR